MTQKLELDAQTGKAVVRELTQAEAEQRTKDLAKHAALAEAKEQDDTAQAAARQNAIAKLTALGLTADETAALFG